MPKQEEELRVGRRYLYLRGLTHLETVLNIRSFSARSLASTIEGVMPHIVTHNRMILLEFNLKTYPPVTASFFRYESRPPTQNKVQR